MIDLFKVSMSEDVMDYVKPILHSGYIGEGSEVVAFENDLARNLNSPWQPISTNSCTSAINLVLLELGVGPGDEVITTPMTCVATNNSILLLGARPIWADVEEETGLIKEEEVKKLITKRTKAIIAVDWTGRRCNYPELKKYGIPVIQDASHGVYFDSHYCGDYVCLSFGPIKHLTCGDGGAIFTPHNQESLRKLRWYGLDRTSSQDFRCSQNIEKVGSKFHMNNINAAIGRANLKNLLKNVRKHKSNAIYLYDNINDGLEITPYFSHNSDYWVFPLNIPQGRDRFIEYLQKSQITASRVHARNDKHTAFNYPGQALPGVDEFDFTQVNIPCGWWVTTEELEYMVRVINSWKGYFNA